MTTTSFLTIQTKIGISFLLSLVMKYKKISIFHAIKETIEVLGKLLFQTVQSQKKFKWKNGPIPPTLLYNGISLTLKMRNNR
jgi:hypothetical protein